MRRWIIGVTLLVVLAGVAFLALSGGLFQMSASAESAEGETPLPVVKETNRVIAEAKVVPIQYAELSLSAGGVVAEVLVAEDDAVEAGQVLVRLEAARQAAAVAQAEAGLRRAQAQLDALKAGPRPQEIAVAQAAVEAAQAGLTMINEGARPEEVAAAEVALAAAQASLQKVLEGPDEEQITIAAANLRRVEVALQQAQWAYDQVAYGDEVSGSPQAAQLEQATLDYETALASYQLAVRGPSDAEVITARAQLAQAAATLALLRQGASDAEVAAAEAEIRRAQAQLDLVTAGARPEAIAAAEADVAAAEAILAQARVALTETELRAPFSGTIADLDAKVGEMITPSIPVTKLADFSAWQIETEDLTELGVVEVSRGAPVTITVDAIPDMEIPGEVVRVKAIGEDRHGDITYTVVIQPQRQEKLLRWNMTTAVFIEPQSADGLAHTPQDSQ